MQKIIEQNLNDPEVKALYTWEKDETAWLFNTVYRYVFKVKFTGGRWLSVRREKIYQFYYLDSSVNHELKVKELDYHNGVSHDNEEAFYTTREEAINLGIRYIEREKELALLKYEKDLKRINEYKEKEND